MAVARRIFGAFVAVDAVLFAAGETGAALFLALHLAAAAISQIPPQENAPVKRKPVIADKPRSWLMRSPAISEDYGRRLTSGPAVAFGIAVLFIFIFGVSLLIG